MHLWAEPAPLLPWGAECSFLWSCVVCGSKLAFPGRTGVQCSKNALFLFGICGAVVFGHHTDPRHSVDATWGTFRSVTGAWRAEVLVHVQKYTIKNSIGPNWKFQVLVCTDKPNVSQHWPMLASLTGVLLTQLPEVNISPPWILSAVPW